MNKTEISEFAKCVLHGAYDLTLLGPIDIAEALTAAESEIEDLLRLNNPQTLQKRNSWLKLPGTSDQSYLERVFAADHKKKFLAGIRHAGGNRDLPFIHVTTAFTPTSWGEIEQIKKIVRSEFALFRPKHFAIWLNPNSTFALELENTVQPARRYLAARIKDVLSAHTPQAYDSIRIELVKDADYFQWYEKEYQRFHSNFPNLKSWVTISDFEDLEKYRSENLLFRAFVGQQTVGMIGGNAEPLLGLNGLYMGELLIADGFKGKSLAPAMQRKFIEEAGKHLEVVWGTIDARNIPSTKTALRVGRRPIRTEYFLPLT